MLGVLLERSGLLRSADEVLSGNLANDGSEMAPHLDDARVNLARVKLKLGSYEEACALCAALPEERLASSKGAGGILAAAHFAAGRLPEAYQVYQALLAVSTSDEERSQLLAAMAAVAYKVQGADAAKTLLFQSCQVSE